jgi:TorA maturation chaperone TorD
MQAAATPIALQRRVPAEEAARADVYALLARLFHSAPDATLLAALASAPELGGDGALDRAWRDVCLASRAMDAEAARDEYEALFGGVGKSAISLYAGYYAGAPAVDHPRVRVQRDMAALGLAPRADNAEPEDHFAALFDVMRVAVAGGAGREAADLEQQRRFFEGHVAPAAPPFFGALESAQHANYYRKVARFGAAFLELEQQGFELD